MEKPLSELVPLIETIIGRSKEVSFAASTTPSAIKSALAIEANKLINKN